MDFKEACKDGNIEIVKLMIDSNDLNDGLSNASRYGHFDLVKFLIDKGANDFDNGLWQICMNGYGQYGRKILDGHSDIINLLIKKIEEPNFNNYVRLACIGGQIDIIRLLFENGEKNNYNFDMNYFLSFIHGHNDLVNFIILKGAKNYNHDHLTEFKKFKKSVLIGLNNNLIKMVLNKY